LGECLCGGAAGGDGNAIGGPGAGGGQNFEGKGPKATGFLGGKFRSFRGRKSRGGGGGPVGRPKGFFPGGPGAGIKHRSGSDCRGFGSGRQEHGEGFVWGAGEIAVPLITSEELGRRRGFGTTFRGGVNNKQTGGIKRGPALSLFARELKFLVFFPRFPFGGGGICRRNKSFFSSGTGRAGQGRGGKFFRDFGRWLLVAVWNMARGRRGNEKKSKKKLRRRGISGVLVGGRNFADFFRPDPWYWVGGGKWGLDSVSP